MRSSAGHHSFDDRSVLGVRQAIGPDKGIAMFLVKCGQLQRIVHRAAEFGLVEANDHHRREQCNGGVVRVCRPHLALCLMGNQAPGDGLT